MKIGVYKRKSGRFQVYFSFEGKQIHLQKLPWGKTLDNETDVTLLKAHLKKFGYQPEKWGQELPFQFDHAVQVWLKSSNVSPEWLQHRREIASKFFQPHFKKMDLRKILTAHIQEFYTTLLDKKYSPKYCKNVMGELHNLFNFYKKSLPTFPDFPTITIQESIIRWLSEEDQAKVFKFIPDEDRPIFELMRRYGLRTNEAGGLLKKNVFLNHTPPYFVVAITIRKNGEVKETTKTKMARVLPIIDETRWIFETNGDSIFVFIKRGRHYTSKRMNSVWKKANKASGVQIINLYNGVRHSFAMQRLNNGFSLDEVKTMLGHTSSRMTERYARYTLKSLENIVRGGSYSPVIQTTDMKLLDFKGKDWLGDEESNLDSRSQSPASYH
jgi:integrase